MKKGYENQINFIQSLIAFGLIILLLLGIGLHCDFYYDLNDDVLIKDIIAGAYSGSPDGHNNQLLYPISALISALYAVLPSLPWFGLFLCGCHVVAIGFIVNRTYQMLKEKRIYCGLIIFAEVLLIFLLLLWELVYVQYTVTCAVLVASACFLTYTNAYEREIKVFLKRNIPSLILIFVALNIRSEMFLLMCPFIAFVGVTLWMEDALKQGKKSFVVRLFDKGVAVKYISLAVAIICVFAFSMVMDSVAYSSEAWKNYRDFFDARTQVYDYTWYPEYEEATEFYHEIGLERAQVALIDNYNFGIDKEINADTLWSIADYANAVGTKQPLQHRIKEAIVDYKWRSFHEQDAPYNYIVWFTYIVLIGVCIVNKDKTVIFKLPLLLLFRSVSWMYVILAKRVPTRISHPLYFIEFIVLLSMVLNGVVQYIQEKEQIVIKQKRVKTIIGSVAILLFVIVVLFGLFDTMNQIKDEQYRRELVNEQIDLFDDYAKKNPDCYYYLDVYSTVDFSEKIFHNVDNRLKNYSIMGGWGARSPLQTEITTKYAFGKQEDGPTSLIGNMSVAEQLLLDNFYFVINKNGDVGFLEDFYATQNMRIVINCVETVGEFEVYQIRADYDRE